MKTCTLELDMTCHNWGSPADGARTRCCPDGASWSSLALAPGVEPPTDTTRTVEAIGGWSLRESKKKQLTEFKYSLSNTILITLSCPISIGKYNRLWWLCLYLFWYIISHALMYGDKTFISNSKLWKTYAINT